MLESYKTITEVVWPSLEFCKQDLVENISIKLLAWAVDSWACTLVHFCFGWNFRHMSWHNWLQEGSRWIRWKQLSRTIYWKSKYTSKISIIEWFVKTLQTRWDYSTWNLLIFVDTIYDTCFQVYTCLSDIGGMFGLWVGCSLVSFIELLNLCAQSLQFLPHILSEKSKKSSKTPIIECTS